MQVKIINNSDYPLPEFQSEGAAGADVYANIKDEIELESLERILVPTGISLQIPRGYEVQVRPRSGLAHKQGLTVLNSPGTIDSDYRGELFVNIVNLSKEKVIIKPGERIAQLVFAKHEVPEFIEADKLDETERGAQGHGSTS